MPGGTGHPITLGPDEYYLLGDNSPASLDSRWFHPLPNHQPGALPRNQIQGPLTAIYWPPHRIHRLN